MDITPLIPSGKKIITGYGEGAFKINNDPHTGSIIITTDLVLGWHISEFKDLTPESLSILFENVRNTEIVIIGCGLQHQRLQSDIYSAFRSKNISVEIMSTGAACRTYNVLLGEGRHVAAALIAV